MKLKQIAATLMLIGLSPLAMADFTIQDIRVEGLQRTEPSTVFNYLPVKIGDTFTDAKSEEIIKNLYATGFFDDVRVETLGNQVLLTVVERPTISSVNITGAKMLQNEAIKKNFDAFGLMQSQPFNQAKLNEALAGLKQEYITRGKQSVQITPTVTKLARIVGIPKSLKELGVKEEDFDVLAENSLKDVCGFTNPIQANKEQIVGIFRTAFDPA